MYMWRGCAVTTGPYAYRCAALVVVGEKVTYINKKKRNLDSGST